MKLLSLRGNSKLGPRVATTTLPIAQTCPTTCMHHPSREATCYAYQGPMRWHQDKIGAVGMSPTALATLEALTMKDIPPGTLTRLHVAGEWINTAHVRAVARQVKHRALRAWTYTHRWATLKRDAFDKINVLASCETVKDAVAAWFKGYAPALVVPKFESPRAYPLRYPSGDPSGFTGIPCPAQTKAAVVCEDCKLCLRTEWLHAERKVILFEAHGSRAKKLAEKLIQIGGVS
jgi:hypothetical protein